MSPDLYYAVSAFNEEATILPCLRSLATQTTDSKVETLVCIDGSTDQTEERVLDAQRQFKKLNIRLVSSGNGKSVAQNSMVRSVDDRSAPIVFVDGDVVLDPVCVKLLERDVRSIPKLIVVGAWPIPYWREDFSVWQQFLFEVLHARALHPQAETAVHDVSDFKWYWQLNPQTRVSPEFERRSKTYFHARTFLLRGSEYFDLPDDANYADDTFIANRLHTRYGPGVIRTRYDAIAYYRPYLSIRQHFNAYRRIYADLRRIDQIGAFGKSRRLEATKLDWKYIRSCGLRAWIDFSMYVLIRQAERALFRLLPVSTLANLWKEEKVNGQPAWRLTVGSTSKSFSSSLHQLVSTSECNGRSSSMAGDTLPKELGSRLPDEARQPMIQERS